MNHNCAYKWNETKGKARQGINHTGRMDIRGAGRTYSYIHAHTHRHGEGTSSIPAPR